MRDVNRLHINKGEEKRKKSSKSLQKLSKKIELGNPPLINNEERKELKKGRKESRYYRTEA